MNMDMNMDSNGFECVFLFPWILRAFSGEVCVILLYHALTKSEYFFGWESVPLKFCERMSRMSIAILGDQIARDRRICTVSPPHEHLISPGSLKSLLATRWSWCWRVQRCCQPSKGTVLLKFFCLQYQQEPTIIFVYTKIHKVYTAYSWPTV